MEIHTPRLRLRRARIDDLDAIHAMMSDQRAMRFWSTLPHAEIGATRAWLQDMIASEDQGGDDYVIEHLGRVIGKAGCYRLPEIGYMLHPDVWGMGFAGEALSALIPLLFARHGIEALTADVDRENTASIALLLRLGFHETHRASATFNIGGRWVDSIYFALPRPTEAPAGVSLDNG